VARRRIKKKQPQTNLGDLRVVAIALALALIAYFLRDFYGIRYRFVGAYIWIIAFFIWLLVRLFYLAQYILPLNWYDSWFEGLRLSLDHHFPFFMSLVRFRIPSLQLLLPKSDKKDDSKDDMGLPASFKLHRAGVLPSHQVVALGKGDSFTRSAGPGYVRLNKGEKVIQAIDLRPHSRRKSVSALTRDGIRLDTTVNVVFHVKRETDPIDRRMPYSYDRQAIFKIIYVDSFSSGEGSVPWTERVVRQAESALISEISRFSLDELLLWEPGTTPPLVEVGKAVKERLDKSFEKHGITIVSAGTGPMELPEEVTDQRIRNWQADWLIRMEEEKSAGDTEVYWQHMLARAYSQIEIIDQIMKSIELMRANDEVELTEVIALRMIEAIEEAAADEKVQELIPQQAIVTLRQMQSWMQEWGF
jgi:hypothetical protein